MLNSIITATSAAVTPQSFLICTAVSVICGIAVALIHRFKNVSSKSFVITLALLPVIVQAVIMMVNGNLGAGIAVAGAFSLVRFRSAPGSAKDICSVFLAMAVGLATGTGFVAVAVILTAVVGILSVVFCATSFGETPARLKTLKITIPENLDYSGLFDDLFEKYTTAASLTKVKTANLGSMFQLTYEISLKDVRAEKEFIDELRCRNGNLDIICAKAANKTEL